MILAEIRQILHTAAALGARIPDDITQVIAAHFHTLHALNDLPTPDSVWRAGVSSVTSRADAVALLDEYVDAATRHQHAGELRRGIEDDTVALILTRLRHGGLDEILSSLRDYPRWLPGLDTSKPLSEKIADDMAAYLAHVPAELTISAFLAAGADAAAAWAEGRLTRAFLNALAFDVLLQLIRFGGVLDPSPDIPEKERLAAFLTAPGTSLRAAGLRLYAPENASDNDPLGTRWRNFGHVQINTLTEAAAIVAAAQADYTERIGTYDITPATEGE